MAHYRNKKDNTPNNNYKKGQRVMTLKQFNWHYPPILEDIRDITDPIVLYLNKISSN